MLILSKLLRKGDTAETKFTALPKTTGKPDKIFEITVSDVGHQAARSWSPAEGKQVRETLQELPGHISGRANPENVMVF